MRWERGHRSRDVIDERGQSFGGGGGGGLLWLLFSVAARFGLPGVLALIGVLVCLGVCVGPSNLVGTNPGGDEAATTTSAGDEQVQFVSFVLDDVQSVWAQKLAQRGVRYDPAKLVLYTDSTTTGCGYGAAATGPFYCPADQRVYLDLSFNRELADRFGAPGDFAEAYVIAHEVGHHVQHELGLDQRVQRASTEGASGASVRFELQADCFAGIWAASTDQRGLLEPGDVAEAIRAASAVGDDRLQRQAQGTVTPDSFTHGTSAQRMRWFQAGYNGQTIESCDTFSASQL